MNSKSLITSVSAALILTFTVATDAEAQSITVINIGAWTQLTIKGTNGDDTIGITTSNGGYVKVYINGTWTKPYNPATGSALLASAVGFIEIFALDGNDWIDIWDVDPSRGFVGMFTAVYGGGGNDNLFGSAFLDFFFGGSGWDRFFLFQGGSDFAGSDVEQVF